ncbi:MAG TPA: asparagine synthase (glutamine-hydrolyzing) [Pyrinomonadaceae bacterium]|nr:asparagine synthase (glutamine-hydrolyzing) [Pyrinomonadaceae bacterium]
MCGITGWINLSSSKPADHTEAVLHSMCETILHRGPDSEGIWMDKSVALGMRRLSIIDLKTGDQPVFSEDRSIVAMQNGELYNYREVRDELEKKGQKFLTKTDTEVIPHLYEEYGEDFVDHLNGMFAIALWDSRRKKLILARDRFGEKPLYYGIFAGKLLYASEPKALLAHPSVKRELDLDALREYLSFDYVPAPRSIYKGISKLPAAHILVVENGEIRTRRYWNMSWQKPERQRGVNGTGLTAKATELRELLSDAVRMRLVSDVPLGILLSGGVDSSTVAAFATQHASEKVKTFSIGFEEDSFDESKYARQVAHHLGTEHYEATLSVETAADLIGDIGTWLDEPLSDGSLIPTFMLARFVRHHVTVALGGDGGDELFAGYPMYYGHKVAKAYSRLPAFIRSGVVAPIVNRLPVSTKNLSFEYRAKRFVRSSTWDAVRRHHSWFGSFSLDEQDALLSPHVRENSSGDVYKDARDLLALCDACDEVEQMQFLDINFYMAEDILTKVDRAAMAVSLETRAPFLDPRIAQFAASLPLNYKLHGSQGKYILKKALKPLLPQNILHRKKKGFGIPIADWLKGRLNPLMHDLLDEKRLREQGLFDPAFVTQLIREHETGVASNHKQLWTLVVFQLWIDNFLK